MKALRVIPPVPFRAHLRDGTERRAVIEITVVPLLAGGRMETSWRVLALDDGGELSPGDVTAETDRFVSACVDGLLERVCEVAMGLAAVDAEASA